MGSHAQNRRGDSVPIERVSESPRRHPGFVPTPFRPRLRHSITSGVRSPNAETPIPVPLTRIDLPEPELDGTTSVARAIATRASRRTFADEPEGLAAVSQLLWAAQGITHTGDGIEMRAAPSAGATYPFVAFLEVAPGGCERLDAGVYRYEPTDHELRRSVETAVRGELVSAALNQPVVERAPATIALAAEFDRTVREYPDHGERYVHMEAGHIAQNVHLVCEGRELHSCPVGAFADAEVASALRLAERLDPLYLVPFGAATDRRT